MEKIKIEKLSDGELRKRGVSSWPIWEKEVSKFDWSYESIEECYFLEGDVILEAKDGRKVHFGKGDFVVFPKGLSCNWQINSPVKKHYNFK